MRQYKRCGLSTNVSQLSDRSRRYSKPPVMNAPFLNWPRVFNSKPLVMARTPRLLPRSLAKVTKLLGAMPRVASGASKRPQTG